MHSLGEGSCGCGEAERARPLPRGWGRERPDAEVGYEYHLLAAPCQRAGSRRRQGPASDYDHVDCPPFNHGAMLGGHQAA